MKKKVLTRSVGIMLSEDMYFQIKKNTDEKDISISEFIRDAVQQKLTKETNS